MSAWTRKRHALGVGYFTCMAFATAKITSGMIGRDWAKERDNDDEEEDEHDPVERTLQWKQRIDMQLGLMTKTSKKVCGIS